MKQAEPYFVNKQLKKFIKKLDGKAFFVGGCVRDFLIHRGISDIDMATPFTPKVVRKKLTDLPITVIPTGILHGTLTLIFRKDKQEVQITSFRKDVKTDGRHALVEFGKSMEEDAKRRDLTINALYMDKDGQIFDFVGGLKDLKHKRIRFIGNPDQRIKEDCLRILRFFRFYGLFSKAVPDKASLTACRKNKQLIANISRERVKDEMFKILSLPNPYPVLYLMKQTGVLQQIVQQPVKLPLFRHLLSQEKKAGVQPCPLFRAWVLCDKQLLPFKLSAHEKKQVRTWMDANQHPIQTYNHFLNILFLYDQQTFLNMILLKKKRLNFQCYRYMQTIKAPVCPFTEKDIMNYFHVQGEEISKIYKKAIFIWQKNGFPKKDVVFCAISR